jgi:hypothetical protein
MLVPEAEKNFGLERLNEPLKVRTPDAVSPADPVSGSLHPLIESTNTYPKSSRQRQRA